MSTAMIAMLVAVVIVLVAIAIAGAAWIYIHSRRTKELRSRFGPEYDRTVRTEGTNRQAERVLAEREKRVQQFEIKPLAERERRNFALAWEQQQAYFVDQPRDAVRNADKLVTEVMKVRGYPMADFEQRAADVSVDHPVVVENYRVAHRIALGDGEHPASTEELREAMIHYRALFADLLHDGGSYPVREVRPENQTAARAKEAGR